MSRGGDCGRDKLVAVNGKCRSLCLKTASRGLFRIAVMLVHGQVTPAPAALFNDCLQRLAQDFALLPLCALPHAAAPAAAGLKADCTP